MDKKYDIGIMGVWPGCNYGSIMTYYALNNVVKSLGYSVLMIDKPLPPPGKKDIELSETHSRRFAKEHYDIAPIYELENFKKYNDLCDTFLLGSDQLWNYGISKHFGKAFYFDFVNDDKGKIAYATSFGHKIDFAPDSERKIISSYMKRFDAISVREHDGVTICKDVYGVNAEQVIDPVFMVDPEKIYRPLIEKSTHKETEPFIAAYILDPTPEKREALLHISKKFGGMKIINLLDGLYWLFDENKKKLNLDNCIENLQVEDWLYYLSNAQFVVTDSCHGASFAMIFKKNFIAITNLGRGISRFRSLAEMFDFSDRLVTDVNRIKTDDSLFEPIDYNKIDNIMKREVSKSMAWFKNAIEISSHKTPKTDFKPVVNKSEALVSNQNKTGKKYDVGIIGLWFGRNYGSMATYYALNQVIKKMGYSVLMIDNPLRRDEELTVTKTHPYRLANMFYNISEKKRLRNLHELNNDCESFIIGSDQLWSVRRSRRYKQMYFLDFVDDNTKKISYATSFGKKYAGTEEERVETLKNLQRFDNISVRDDLSVEICKNSFGVDASLVCDPSFLCDISDYDKLTEIANLNEPKPYILAYVLDPNPEIGKQLEALSIEKNMKVIVLLDEWPDRRELNKNHISLSGKGNVEIKNDVDIFEWMWYYKNASCVFTDSFHGTIFSIIFRKPFITLMNHGRGAQRFISLLEPLNLKYRLFDTPKCITENSNLLNSCDYTVPYQKLDVIRQNSYNWLKNSLEAKKGANTTITNVPAVVNSATPAVKRQPMGDMYKFDFERCKLLVTLLKEYGIKHVVLSSGGRNVNLVRLFEAEPFFKTYSIIDERSAGFFAMGLALRLNETVAMCCTSGTAASNYLTSVTEAFYQQVPLIVITADRYPAWLGQGEDQKIPQSGIFNGVVKKSVTLPINQDSLGEWEARRLICEAVLEANHHGKGPVHINVPIESVQNTLPTKEELKLSTKRVPIRRLTLADTSENWQTMVDRLASKKRILLLYCQNNPLTAEEQKSVEAFVEKFNCVVVTDHLSNFACSKSFNACKVLDSLTVEQFNDLLVPEIVISVGGRKMLNSPVTRRLRGNRRMFNWRVAEDGEVCDTYCRLSYIFECSQKYFFDYFVKHSGNIHNDNEYYNAWKKVEDDVSPNPTDQYSQLYAIQKIIPQLPSHSLLHIGIGNTIKMSNRSMLDPTVQVYCNMGTNGIDGSASTFMGHVVVSDELCFLLIGDLSFFYDMNSVWNNNLKGNIRIMMFNNSGAGLLKHFRSPAITHKHVTPAEAWVKSVGFKYLSSNSKEEFNENLKIFLSDEDAPMFFEVFC